MNEDFIYVKADFLAIRPRLDSKYAQCIKLLDKIKKTKSSETMEKQFVFLASDIIKDDRRDRVKKKATELGHCVCSKAFKCPCRFFRERNICHCAGESTGVSQQDWTAYNSNDHKMFEPG